MRHRQFNVAGIEQPVVLFHNPDWSGIAVIEWWNGRNTERVKIPACILLHLSFEHTTRFVLSELEHTVTQKLKTLGVDPGQHAKPKKGNRNGSRSR